MDGGILKASYLRLVLPHQRDVQRGMHCLPGCPCESPAALAAELLAAQGLNPARAPVRVWDDVAQFLQCSEKEA
jgi:hypothetical protein